MWDHFCESRVTSGGRGVSRDNKSKISNTIASKMEYDETPIGGVSIIIL